MFTHEDLVPACESNKERVGLWVGAMAVLNFTIRLADQTADLDRVQAALDFAKDLQRVMSEAEFDGDVDAER